MMTNKQLFRYSAGRSGWRGSIQTWLLPSLLLAMVLIQALPLLAQHNGVIYIDPNRSDPKLRRVLIINSNRVSTDITNYGTIARGNDSNPDDGAGGVWPTGTGHDHIHEMTGFIAARVIDRNGTPIHIISDGYRDPGGATSEIDPISNIEYTFHPLPGYFNPAKGQEEIANSRNPNSWPDAWPGKDNTWNQKWNGYFGLNQFNADQEVLYVMDDTWNEEFQFYPYLDQPDRRGLGMQVETRLFQWAHPLAKDIIFIHYQVSNAGNYNYNIQSDSIFFGGYADIGPGGRGTTDDDAAFREDLDLVYGWDHDNIGVWGKFREIAPGYLGWKFLESPGIENDGRDNDDDGLIDESRSNDAGTLIVGPIGRYGDPREHWSGDEDGDWNPVIDDVGSDGAGPLDEGYPGPDADGTEGNGRPDQGEPNFGKLDNDESDQVGLTSFTAPLFGTVLITDEEKMWPRIKPGYFTVPQQSVNQYWIFGSGPFNLPARKTERFSTCWVFGIDEQSMLQNGNVAQRIYDSDYRFARPPRQPKLTAVPGDKQVVLIWDDLAELSRDPIYGYDFEGYRIYRSTDPQFLDVQPITDASGNQAFLFGKPLAQFDLVDGLKGPHPLQLGEEVGNPLGIHFYMGDDTGLRHYFVDRDVINGRTYYYAITAYDKGYDMDFYQRGISEFENLFPITPSESPASIVVTGGIITYMDPNTAEVTPNAPPSDVSPGSTDVAGVLNHEAGRATGHIEVEIIAPDLLDDASYVVEFDTVTTRTGYTYLTTHYSIFNETSGQYLLENEPIPKEANGAYKTTWSREFLLKGFVLTFNNEYPDLESTIKQSGWDKTAQTNLVAELEQWTPDVIYPQSFVIEFGDSSAVLDSAYNSSTTRVKGPVNFKVYELQSNQPVLVWLDELSSSKNGRVDPGERIVTLYKRQPSDSRFQRAWKITFSEPKDNEGTPLPASQWIRPQNGDKYYVINKIPFLTTDSYRYSTLKGKQLSSVEESILKQVKVVPNPYVVSSILERQPYLRGRGERIIRFINLPSQCTIRIYTVYGDLVTTLEHNGLSDGTVKWDLRTNDGLEVAFGLYVYHIDAPGIGQHIGKFAIVN